jgi:hypothetical protein
MGLPQTYCVLEGLVAVDYKKFGVAFTAILIINHAVGLNLR